MKPVILHAEARIELSDASSYYEANSARLANGFLEAFEKASDSIRANPYLHADEEGDGIRYCPIGRFPYLIVYIDLEDHFWVVAVMHERRQPRYWANRLSN